MLIIFPSMAPCPIRWLFLLGLLVSIPPNISADRILLPDIAGTAESVFTPAEEQRIGRIFMRSVREELPVIEDPIFSDYINSIGLRLANRADSGARSFYFFLIDKAAVNAFAGPAGNIGIYSGLVLATENESELAAVLAHEISHITQNHLTRAFEDASNMSAPTVALLFAALLLGATAGTNAGLAAAVGIQAASLQQRINFTRGNEQEADSMGIKVLAAAGFNPHAMPGFFERLSKASRLYANNAPEFLLTHPVTTNRIADALGRADAYPYRQRLDAPDYFMIRAALRERTFHNPARAVKHFRTTLATKRYRQKTAERYGYARALFRAHKLKQARQEIRRLLRRFPTNTAYMVLDSQIDAASGQTKRALKTLSRALKLFPSNTSLASAYARLSLVQGRPRPAAKPLDRVLAQHSKEPSLYRLRAQIAFAAKQRADAYLFLAEASSLDGQLETAVQQIGAALRTERFTNYAEFKLRARLKELKSELEAMKKAKKRVDM